MLIIMHVRSMHSFSQYEKNMDSSEVDFALLLMAEKQAAIHVSKKKMENQQTNKQTHKCQIIVL